MNRYNQDDKISLGFLIFWCVKGVLRSYYLKTADLEKRLKIISQFYAHLFLNNRRQEFEEENL